MFLSSDQVHGHLVNLLRTNEKHMFGSDEFIMPEENTEESFGKLFANALDNVNNEQLQSMELSQLMITDPDSVDVHDVTIAMAEANLSLSMTKSIVDGVIKAYNNIISTR
jgi:flagellar hook-basal body complex protein FliE